MLIVIFLLICIAIAVGAGPTILTGLGWIFGIIFGFLLLCLIAAMFGGRR